MTIPRPLTTNERLRNELIRQRETRRDNEHIAEDSITAFFDDISLRSGVPASELRRALAVTIDRDCGSVVSPFGIPDGLYIKADGQHTRLPGDTSLYVRASDRGEFFRIKRGRIVQILHPNGNTGELVVTQETESELDSFEVGLLLGVVTKAKGRHINKDALETLINKLQRARKVTLNFVDEPSQQAGNDPNGSDTRGPG